MEKKENHNTFNEENILNSFNDIDNEINKVTSIINELGDTLKDTLGDNREYILALKNGIIKLEDFIKENSETTNEKCDEIRNVVKGLVLLLLETHSKGAKFIEQIQKKHKKLNEINTKLEKENESLKKDKLTKLGNRFLFDKDFEILLNDYLYNNKELSFGIIDIDNFKTINDTYGHLFGDNVLIYLANFLQKNLKSSISIYRFGGEEFVFLFQGNKEELLSELNKVLNKLNKTQIVSKSNNNIKFKLSFSGGVTGLNQEELFEFTENNVSKTFVYELLYKKADELLYKVKHTTKNKVIM